jgi:hypothetical protein
MVNEHVWLLLRVALLAQSEVQASLHFGILESCIFLAFVSGKFLGELSLYLLPSTVRRASDAPGGSREKGANSAQRAKCDQR